tara:strand:- start:198 stop:431 length:234 start_codon:yes stop_codon:yes gene_type:complete
MNKETLHFCVDHIKEAGKMVQYVAQQKRLLGSSGGSDVLRALRKKSKPERKALMKKLNKGLEVMTPAQEARLSRFVS